MSFSNFARVNAGSGYIVGARLVTDKKSVTPRFRVHLFNTSNPTLSADNAAHQSLYADESKRIGVFDLPAMSTPSDTTNSTLSGASDYTLRVPFVAATGNGINFLPTVSGQLLGFSGNCRFLGKAVIEAR